MCSNVYASIDTDNNDTSMTGDPFIIFFFFLFFMPSLFPFLFHGTIHHIMSQWLLLCSVILVAVVVAPFKSKVFYEPFDCCMGSTIRWIHRLLINICTNTHSLLQMKCNIHRRCFSFEFWEKKKYFFNPSSHICTQMTKAAHTMHQKIFERLYVAQLEQPKLMAILITTQNSKSLIFRLFAFAHRKNDF